MESEIRARGVNFIYTKEFIKVKYGEQVWDKLISLLSPETSEIWKTNQLSLSSYPFSAFKEMVHALSKEIDSDETGSIAELYSYIADKSLSSLYKVFFKLSQPSFVLKNYPRLWKRFFTSGEVDVLFADNGSAEIKFILPEIFLDWLPGVCYGFSRKAVEMAGGKETRVKEKTKKKLSESAYEIVYTVEWK